MNIGWRERNQQDATNPMLIIKLLSQNVSGIIMPIFRRTRPCTTVYGVLVVLAVVVWNWVVSFVHCVKVTVRTVTITQCTELTTQLYTTTASTTTTPYIVVHGLVLLKMGILMPETCWDRSLIISIGLVASCWFFSLHPRTRLRSKLFNKYRVNILYMMSVLKVDKI